jgi:ABC-type branched-subunit amino acid transport system ATPase component
MRRWSFYLRLVGLHQLADQACSQLAYGDVKRLELAIALANEPLLYFDG